jgi:hypothetical protein
VMEFELHFVISFESRIFPIFSMLKIIRFMVTRPLRSLICSSGIPPKRRESHPRANSTALKSKHHMHTHSCIYEISDAPWHLCTRDAPCSGSPIRVQAAATVHRPRSHSLCLSAWRHPAPPCSVSTSPHSVFMPHSAEARRKQSGRQVHLARVLRDKGFQDFNAVQAPLQAY